MNYFVRTTRRFEAEFKRLLKKYPSLSKEVFELILLLESNPTQGIPLGLGCYKLRLSIKSKGKGKSGGARVITCVHVIKQSVELLSIYDKSEQDSIQIADLRQLVSELDQD
jgi:mRNA-degrading endonuclease RelE of RelBE toxin-antitoxin system